jgi:hypothetical protein
MTATMKIYPVLNTELGIYGISGIKLTLTNRVAAVECLFSRE